MVQRRPSRPAVSLEAVEAAARAAWAVDTSSDPDRWSADNAAWGQCAVTSLLVQDFFGGDLLRTEVEGISHYWIRTPDGREVDLTREQFGPHAKVGPGEARDRNYVLSFPQTRRRYDLLRRRVQAAFARAA
jgi:hypothetical protein